MITSAPLERYRIDHSHLLTANGGPLYKQVANALKVEISQNYKAGDLIPTENEICDSFSVSRTTVREAINLLVEEGLIEKKQGKGTIVKDRKITHSLQGITSWTDQILSLGLIPKTKELEVKRISPPRKLQMLMGISEDEMLIQIKRIRYANSEPLSIMTNYLLESAVPGFMELKHDFDSLYSFLKEKYNLVIDEAEENVEAKEANEYEAEMLKIPTYSPVLFVTRVSTYRERVIEVVYLCSRADKYKYKVHLTAID